MRTSTSGLRLVGQMSSRFFSDILIAIQGNQTLKIVWDFVLVDKDRGVRRDYTTQSTHIIQHFVGFYIVSEFIDDIVSIR